MRLIDAERLREIVEDGLRNNPHNEGYARTCHRIEYTHFLDVICRMPTITPPPNDPLTLEELRQMDGEPVWLIWAGHPQTGWALVRVWSKPENVIYLTYNNGVTDIAEFVLNDGGEIYRYKPEEGQDETTGML